MKIFDKIKDLFSDEEEVVETKEVEVEENAEHKLPTFMRNKIEAEQKKEKKSINSLPKEEVISDREVIKTRSNNSFSFPVEIDENDIFGRDYSSQNVLLKDREKEKSIADLYTKKEEPKPKRFKPTPVISPVYGVLDKNYTKDEVKLQDEALYEIQRPSRTVDFETVRNKAFGNLTDDIRNNMCENCELYQEVKITKNADKNKLQDEVGLLDDMKEDAPKEDVSLGDAEDNYFDFGVSYEPPKEDSKESTVINIDELEIKNDIKIINHNDEEKPAEKIEVKEEIEKEKLAENDLKSEKKVDKEELPDDKEIDNIPIPDATLEENMDNDIFNLIDSMYDGEEK